MSAAGTPEDRGRGRFRERLAYVIVAAWLVSNVIHGLVPSFEVPTPLSELMLGVAGWAFGSSFFRNQP